MLELRKIETSKRDLLGDCDIFAHRRLQPHCTLGWAGPAHVATSAASAAAQLAPGAQTGRTCVTRCTVELSGAEWSSTHTTRAQFELIRAHSELVRAHLMST